MDKVVPFFQVCHATDQPLCKQHQCEAAAKNECKEANQERDAANKKCVASGRNNSSSTDNSRSKKHVHTENLCHHCKTKGYDFAWSSCSCHNFRHLNYHQLRGSLTNRSQDKSSCDSDEYHNTCNMQSSLLSEPFLWSIWLHGMWLRASSSWLQGARAKVTMLNSVTDPDQERNCNQGPVLVILKTQDTIMVSIFMMMTPGERNGHACLLLSLVWDQTMERPLLEPSLLLFNIKTQFLN